MINNYAVFSLFSDNHHSGTLNIQSLTMHSNYAGYSGISGNYHFNTAALSI